MWRSFFLALGVYCCLLGLQAMVVEKAVLKPRLEQGRVVQPARDVKPPEWAPWSLLSCGAVVALYSFTLPRRVKE